MIGYRANSQSNASDPARPKRPKSPLRPSSRQTNELLNFQIAPWRSKVVLGLLTLGFISLAVRAVYVQVVSQEYLQSEADSRFNQTQQLMATRGKILDRNGTVLASSLPARAVGIVPSMFKPTEEQLARFAQAMGISQVELSRRIENGGKGYFYLQRQMDPQIADKVKALRIVGVEVRPEYKRSYPGGEASAQIVGFTDRDDRGIDGIEHAFQSTLVGQDGSRRVTRNRLGHTIDEDKSQSALPTAGRDVELSIDTRIQDLAFVAVKEAVLEHKARAGSAVVIDVQTGEILALANFPTYNPNQRKGVGAQQMRNRALVDIFEPGSTLKPFTAALALELNKVSVNTTLQTYGGRLTIGGATITDAHPHGTLTVEQIIQKSSNVGTARMATELLGRDALWGFLTQAGFGTAPQVGFPGAAAGRVRAAKNWRPIELATISYGYGVSTSLIQLARSYTVFATDGQLLPVSITRVHGQPEGVRLIKAENAAAIRKMLELAAGPAGTAPKAQTVGYRVAGKTGTARKQAHGKYLDKSYIASFVGFAPASAPRVIIAIMIDEPRNGKYYGGEVAAPVFSRIVEDSLRLLRVAPDAPYRAQLDIPSEAVKESI